MVRPAGDARVVSYRNAGSLTVTRHVAWSSPNWRAYFAHNAQNLLHIPWGNAHRLVDAEREAIASSVQEFQLGESSEARHLMARGRDYARRGGDADYAPALAAFIAEEHRHARDLGRFMDSEGIPRIGSAWPDTVFRWLRHRAGLELSIVVLVTAEIIAKVYYAALREATASPVLRVLCDQILHDEEAHVRFQGERVAILRCRRARWLIPVLDLLHRGLFAGTCAVVWYKHGRALRAGGYGLVPFWRAAWRERGAAAALMDPRRTVAASEELVELSPAAGVDTAAVGE
jgi:hypothetical protein